MKKTKQTKTVKEEASPKKASSIGQRIRERENSTILFSGRKTKTAEQRRTRNLYSLLTERTK